MLVYHPFACKSFYVVCYSAQCINATIPIGIKTSSVFQWADICIILNTIIVIIRIANITHADRKFKLRFPWVR